VPLKKRKALRRQRWEGFLPLRMSELQIEKTAVAFQDG